MLHVVFDVASGAITTTCGHIRSKVRVRRTFVVVVIVTGSGIWIVPVGVAWIRNRLEMGRKGALLLGLGLLWLGRLRLLHRRAEILQGTFTVRRFLAFGWNARFVFDRRRPPWFIDIPVDVGIFGVVTLRCIRHLHLIGLVLRIPQLHGTIRKGIVMKRSLQHPNVNVHGFLFLGTAQRPRQHNRPNQIQ